MKIEIENGIKAVKAVMLSLVGPWSPDDRFAFFQVLQVIVTDCIAACVVKDIKPSNRVERTIATITEVSIPSVSAYQGLDGRLAMIEAQVVPTIPTPKPITVSTVTKKADGTVVRHDPETDAPKLKRRPYYPGMSANKNGLLSYMYYVNKEKVSYALFTHEVLRVIGASLSEKDRNKFTVWGYSIPKVMIRNGEVKEWSKTIGGSTFFVKVDPKSLN